MANLNQNVPKTPLRFKNIYTYIKNLKMQSLPILLRLIFAKPSLKMSWAPLYHMTQQGSGNPSRDCNVHFGNISLPQRRRRFHLFNFILWTNRSLLTSYLPSTSLLPFLRVLPYLQTSYYSSLSPSVFYFPSLHVLPTLPLSLSQLLTSNPSLASSFSGYYPT